MANQHQQQAPVQGATAEHATQITSAEAPIDTANAIVAVEVKSPSPARPEELSDLQPEPIPAPDYEGLKPLQELKRFFDLIGIEAGGNFVVTTCYERKSKETGKWIESWSHYSAQRYGNGGNAELHDYLRYGGHTPSNKGKNKLLNRFRQEDSDTFRATQYYIRTAEFEKDPVDGKVRSFEKEYVKRRRTYSIESDEGTLAQQQERIAYLKSKGLVANAEVYSGNKSIQLHFARPREWETTPTQDAYVDKGLCVLLLGDAAAMEPNNAFRLPGCDRPGGHHQRLLDGRAEPYGSYEELRSLIEALLAEEGIADQAALEAAYVVRKAKSDENRVRTALERSRNSELGREWEGWEGWTESDREAAQAFQQVLSGEQLLDFIPGTAAELVRKGSPAKHRNDDGLMLTLSLRGAVEVLTDLGLGVEEAAQEVLDRFVEASEAVGGPVDVERLQAQYEGAEGAMPGMPVANFMHRLHWATGGQLGHSKKVPLQVCRADGELTKEPEVPAAQPLTPSDLAEFPLFVEYALQQQGVRLITVNGLTYRWVGTHYALWEKERLVRWLTSLARSQTWRRGDNEENRYHPFLSNGNIGSALGWIQTASEIPANAVNPAGMVNCRNGVLEISWKGRKPVAKLVPHDQDRHFFIDPPGALYDPEADPKYADQLLGCLPENSRRLFLQIAAATLDIKKVRCFADRVPAMLMIGEGKNGKDTLREALTAIHGKSSVASMSVQDWQSHQAGSGVGRFKATQLEFAKLSIASENSGAFKIDNLETLKAAISGDRIYVERKGIDGKDIDPHAAFFFFLNRNPLLDGGGVAILSRYAVAMLPHTYSSNPKSGQLKADTRFKHDPEWVAQNVLPGLLNKMLHHLGEVAASGFDLSLTEAPLQELRDETCHLHVFMRETGYVLGDKMESVALSKFYERLMKWYQQEQWIKRSSFGSLEWAPDDGDQPVKAQRLLGKRLKGLFPTVRVEREPGKTRRSRIYGIRRADSIPEED